MYELDKPNNKGVALKGVCCSYPFGYLNGRALMIYSKHAGQTHMLTLSPDQLREIADRIDAERDKMSAGSQARA